MPEHYRPVTSSLRSRLLILTFLFVMVVSAFVYLPSIATFRQDFLEKRMGNAQIAALALEAAENNAISPELEERLLSTSGVIAVVMRGTEKSILLGFDIMPDEVDASYDMRQPSLGSLIFDAFETLEAGGDRAIRVIGDPMIPGVRMLEVTMDEEDLYLALENYSRNILILSTVISLFTGILVYLSLHWMLVRPMRRIKDSIVSFRRKPEQHTPLMQTTLRPDEIGLVARELCRMQEEIRHNIKQNSRLAALGEAVAKINHDLRNILATAQLSSDALQRVDHPGVQKISRRLMTAVSRAVALCESTMRHGKAEDPIPEKRKIDLSELVTDVGLSLGLIDSDSFDFDITLPNKFEIFADPEQIHRVFLNLCRNAQEVQGAEGAIRITAYADEDGTTHVRVTDRGPGIPETVRPSLFKAFSSARAGGMGLGLAIAQDIILAHGGQVALEKTGPEGSVFLICLPWEES
ncbi:MAG: HAMP domain-containing histidine kinase [Kordiimonadaceae bacterium]|nr:HAMP domain-containing histidine kinase [Kordiimonadaceae bacterium]